MGVEYSDGEFVGAQVLPDVSMGLSSGAWGGSFRSVMLSGTLGSFASCHPAASTINRACASVATVLAISARCNSIASVLTNGKISPAAVPRPGQAAPKI